MIMRSAVYVEQQMDGITELYFMTRVEKDKYNSTLTSPQKSCIIYSKAVIKNDT